MVKKRKRIKERKREGRLSGAWGWREEEEGSKGRKEDGSREGRRREKNEFQMNLRTISMVKLEPSFQLSMQELAVYHGKQKLESIKQANAGLSP